MRVHPFDVALGTETSGVIGSEALDVDRATAKQMQAYIGAQPSIVRRTLERLPDRELYTLVDIGCGKGRPLIVASELSFHAVTGVELSATLVATARRNAATIQERFPARPAITVIHGNALQWRPSSDRLVLFYYHAFSREVLTTFIRSLERDLAEREMHAFFVYLNPVDAAVLDQSTHFERWLTAREPYDASELGFGPDSDDTVAVWQSVPARYAPQAGATRRISPTSRTRAELVDADPNP